MRRFMFTIVATLTGVLAAAATYTAVRSHTIEARYPPEGGFVEIGGVRLHYMDIGSERDGLPAVVLVHGASSNLRDMRLALGDRLAARYRVILFDRPGFGWSDANGQDGVASPRRQAELLHAALEALGVGRHVIVGHSWAGALVLAYALAYPESVDGVLALAPASHPWPGGIGWYYSLGAAPVVGRLFSETLFLPIAERLLDSSVRSVFAPQAPPADYARQAAIPLILRPRSFRRNAEDVAGLHDFVSAQARRYSRIAVPLTVVAGTEDRTVWPSIHSASLGRDVPGVRLVMLEGIGHMPHYACPDVVVSEIDLLAGSGDRDQTSSP